MEVTISLHIELDEDRELDVAMIGEIISSRQDGTFIEDISWDRTMYTQEENEAIEMVAFKSGIYDKLFAAYDREMEERKIESLI